ncbi:hypothetical protein EYF80_056525 [Liparis tanakae]|uniref:Uncharacterized protein n=1 Tax=Liparis tanakae TaxID=230148 RepID=A0A4Z2EX29_9TELE|nr:hypothetical protein EYF80_056525 [Liparis tanakae]
MKEAGSHSSDTPVIPRYVAARSGPKGGLKLFKEPVVHKQGKGGSRSPEAATASGKKTKSRDKKTPFDQNKKVRFFSPVPVCDKTKATNDKVQPNPRKPPRVARPLPLPVQEGPSASFNSSSSTSRQLPVARQRSSSPRRLSPAEPSSRRLSPAEPSSRPLNLAEPSSRPLNLAEPSSRRLNPAEPSSRPLNPAEPSSRTLNPAEPSSRRVNPAEPSSRRVNPAEPSSRRLNPAEASRRLNPAEPSSRPLTPLEAASRLPYNPRELSVPPGRPRSRSSSSTRNQPPSKGPASTAQSPSTGKAKEQVKSHRPIGGEIGLRENDVGPEHPRRRHDGASNDRAPRKRLNTPRPATILMKRAAHDAKRWTKAINRVSAKERRVYLEVS